MNVSFKNPQEAVSPINTKLNIKKKMKITNLAIFLLPTQLFIQVQ